MKFLTFADLHEDKEVLDNLLKRASKQDIDFLICCGDISNFGAGLKYNLKKINSLGKKVYLVPGNHEEGDDFPKVVSEYPNLVNLDRAAKIVGEYVFLGYGGGGFTLQDANFRKTAREWYGRYNGKKILLVTHQPPYGNKLDLMGQRHVGNKDFTAFILRIKPKLALSGHLHETVGTVDSIGETKIANPGWDGMVIELN
ncbi:MAG: metallophosphoesterase [Nanoarchaeota archaeon]